MRPPETNRSRRPGRIINQAVRLGLDRQELLRSAGLTEGDLEDPDTRIPSYKTIRLWRHIASKIPNPDIGFVFGKTIAPLRQGGALGYSFVHSRTLGEGLRRLVRYDSIMCETLKVDLRRDRTLWRFEIDTVKGLKEFRPWTDEMTVGALTLARDATGTDLVPAAAAFPYERPDDISAHREFFRCDLKFSEPASAIDFHESQIGLPLVRAEEKLSSYLDRLLDQDLEALPGDETFAMSVVKILWRDLSEGQPVIGEVAAKLAVSPRTLQRRLSEEGTSFNSVVDSLRKDMARELLKDADLAVYEVAYLLGYSDPSAFFRAFRRWHEVSPEEYRRELN